MGEQEQPFRFLSEDEFFNLEPESKVTYLIRAQKVLAAKQTMLHPRPETDDPKDPK